MVKPWLDTIFDTKTRDTQRQMKSYIDYGNVVELTADTTLGAIHMGAVITNTGAAGTITLTLPAAKQGMALKVIRTASYALRVDPDGTETIRGGAAGEYVELQNDGDSVELICVESGQWEFGGGNIYVYAYG